jgi:hypothetical protein
MANCSDASGSMHFHSHVLVVRHQPSLPGVKAHAHSHVQSSRPVMLVEVSLCLDSGSQSVSGPSEGHEERIAFSSHDGSVMVDECSNQQLLVHADEMLIALTGLTQ